MHAVGGGGAGAIIADANISNGDGTFTVTNVADLEPKQNYVQTTSYLAASNPGAWTNWVTWMINNKAKSDLPWYDSSTSTKMKDSFDVGTIDTKQLLRYRVSGNAGKTVSTFLPQLPGKATLRLYPGKGGSLNGSGYGTGKDGEDTRVVYLYEGKAPIEGLLAKGGKGGSGEIDSKITYSLVGGPPTDFGLSSMPSINSKKSGFLDVIEAAEKYEQMKSKVPTNAGDSGNGETQFVYDTDGKVLYEYDKNAGLTNVTRRALSEWNVITNKITANYYKKPYFTTTPNCSQGTESFVTVEREGYCDYDMDNSTDTIDIYKCAIGKVPASVLADISQSTQDGGAGWQKFTVEYNYLTDIYLVKNNPTAYTNAKKFYDCKFDNVFICKTRINNPLIHKCTKNNLNAKQCANGKTAMSRANNKSKYNAFSSGKPERAKCPASDGGDGAVVILW